MIGESSVHRGVEGTGEAIVYGQPGNPMRAFLARKQSVEREQAIKAHQEQIAREARNKKMTDILAVQPEKAFEPFDNQVMDAMKSYRNKVQDFFAKGGDPESPSFKTWNENEKDKVNNIARRSQFLKQVITSTQDEINKNPYLKSDYYNPKIWDMYMDHNGKGLPLDSIDPEKIKNIYQHDPMGFNDAKYVKDYMDGLNENMTSYVTQKAQNNGILTDNTSAKWKGDVYIPDANSDIGVKKGPDGKPLINVTPSLVQSFTNSSTAKNYYSRIAEQQGIPVEQVIAGKVGGLEIQHHPSFSRESSWMQDYMNGGWKPEDKQIADNTFKTIGNIINAFTGPNGKPVSEASPQAREAIGHLAKNLPIGGGKSVGAELVPGTNKPGNSNYMGVKTPNSPNDRLLIKVVNGKGIAHNEEIDLTDEGAVATLFNSLKGAGYMGKKFDKSFDAVAERLNVNPSNMWKGREYQAVNQKAQQALVNDWSAGKSGGVNNFIDRQVDGKRIVHAKQDLSLFGNLKGYELTLDDGSTKYVSKDDYDTFTNIARSDKQTAAPSAPKKSLGIKWSK